MADIELHLVKQIVPYQDASGFGFKIEIFRSEEAASVRIHQHGDYVEIRVNDWSEVRNTIDRMIDFMSDEPLSVSPPGAELNISNEAERTDVSLISQPSLPGSSS